VRLPKTLLPFGYSGSLLHVFQHADGSHGGANCTLAKYNGLLPVSLHSIQNLAQKFEVFSRSDDRFFQPFAQLIFAFVPFAFSQLLVKHNPFFQFAASSPERPFQRFGVLFAKALRRKPVTDKTLEVCQIALLKLV
jgi:hypothetical protein